MDKRLESPLRWLIHLRTPITAQGIGDQLKPALPAPVFGGDNDTAPGNRLLQMAGRSIRHFAWRWVTPLRRRLQGCTGGQQQGKGEHGDLFHYTPNPLGAVPSQKEAGGLTQTCETWLQVMNDIQGKGGR